MTEAERRRRLLEVAREQAKTNPAVAEAIAQYLDKGTPLPPNVAAIVVASGVPLGAGEQTAGGPVANTPDPGSRDRQQQGSSSSGIVPGGARVGGRDERAGAAEAGGAPGPTGTGAPNIAAAIAAAGNQAAANAQRQAEQATGAGGSTPGGASQSAPTGNGTGTSAVTDVQFDPATGISEESYIRYMMQQAGMNPDIVTDSSRAAMRGLLPVLNALRQNYGAANGNVGGGAKDFLTDFARQMTSTGDNFFGNVRQYGQNIAGSSEFQNALSGMQNQSAVAQMYGNLLPLLYAGSNPLYGQSASDQFNKTVNTYNDQDRDSGRPGNTLFNTWLDQQQLSPSMRGIFGR